MSRELVKYDRSTARAHASRRLLVRGLADQRVVTRTVLGNFLSDLRESIRAAFIATAPAVRAAMTALVPVLADAIRQERARRARASRSTTRHTAYRKRQRLRAARVASRRAEKSRKTR